MLDERLLRVGREIFLAALGLPSEGMDSWVIDRMTAILYEQTVRAGQTLFVAGEPAEYVYFMQSGQVRVSHEGKPSWTLKGRWVIGGFEAMSDRPATHTVTALADFDVMRVRIADWLEMLEDSFPLARSAVVNACRALLRLEERVPTGAPPSRPDTSLSHDVPRGPLGLVERLALLLDVRLLRKAGVQALADLAAESREVTIGAGDVILARGAERDDLIRIVDGEVLADREGPHVERHYGPGDLVCGAAVLGGVAAPWQARAITPTRGISFPIEALFDLMEEHFDVVRSTFTALGARRLLLLEHLATQSGDLVLT